MKQRGTDANDLLRHNGDFLRLWTGGAISGLGSTLTVLAYPLLALSVTRSAGLAGLVGLVGLASAALTRLPAGAVVDRARLRRVLVTTDLLRLLTTAALVLSLVSGHPALWQLVVVAAVNASAGAFGEIARSVALRHIVTPTLLAAAAYQLVFGAAVFVLIASLTASGRSPASLGVLFAVAAGGGILGAIATPALTRPAPVVAIRTVGGHGASGGLRGPRSLRALVLLMGWTAVAAFTGFAFLPQPFLAGVLLGCVYFAAAPANAMLLAVQIGRTPPALQGRVMAASFLVAGLVAPLGPPLGGLALDAAGPAVTFVAIASVTVVITLVLQVSRAMQISPSDG